MTAVYKYRANLFDKEKKIRQDTKSLLDGEFFASPFKSLNDPFEGSIDLPTSKKDEHWVTPLIQKIYKAGIYSLAKPLKEEEFPSNELMWAHYANAHQGFCIEYDLEKLTEGSYVKGFDLSNSIHVAYESESPAIVENDSIFKVHKKAFGTKSKYWEYENEVRLVFDSRGVKPIANEAIQSIYFGLNIGYNERQAIIDALKGNKISFFQINRVGYLYKLIATELNFDIEYEIVSTRHNHRVENYTILYRSSCKDKNSMDSFIRELRKKYTKPTNFTIIDDIRVNEIIEKHKSVITDFEIDLLTEHWVAYSSFEAPDTVWMYPEKYNK